MPIMVVREDRFGEVFVHGLGSKGVKSDKVDAGQGAYVVKRVLGDVDSLGYNKMIAKSDQASVLKAVRSKVKQFWSGEMLPQHGAINSSANKSMIERAIREVQSQILCMLLALRARMNTRISMKLPAVYWLVGYSGEALNRFKQDAEDKTVREKKYGKVDYMGVVEFGESVFFLPQVHGNTRREKFECMFRRGIFLGVEQLSDELRVGDGTGVCKVRSGDIRRRPESERWKYEELVKVKGTPWCPMGASGREGGADQPGEPLDKVNIEVPEQEGDEGDTEFAPDAEVVARMMKIIKDDVVDAILVSW